jgi:DNA-nicking Smr family endonuclease
MSKSVLHLDLHDVAKDGRAITEALDGLLVEAAHKRVKKVEIIPGKGCGQLM